MAQLEPQASGALPSYLAKTETAHNLEKYLILGEKLKWADSSRATFVRQIRPVLPFLILLLSIFSFVIAVPIFDYERAMAPVVKSEIISEQQPTSSKDGNFSVFPFLLSTLLISLFSAVWCYAMYIGLVRHTIPSVRLTQSEYGLTQHRILWIKGGKKVKVCSFKISTIQNLQLEELSDGLGDIRISFKPSVGGTTNPFAQTDDRTPRLVISSIPDADRVFKLIFETQMALLKNDKNEDL